jgi:hypothetical protein
MQNAKCKMQNEEWGKFFCFPVFAQNLCEIGCVVAGKGFCYRLSRATFMLAIFCQIANANAEFAYFRQNIGDARASTVLART